MYNYVATAIKCAILLTILTCLSHATSCSTSTPDCTFSHDVCHLDHCSFGTCVSDLSAPDGWKFCIQGSGGSYCCSGALNVVVSGSNCANAAPCSGNAILPPPCLTNGTLCFPSNCGNCCSGYSDVAGTCQTAPPPPACPLGQTNPYSTCQGAFNCTQLSGCGVSNCAVAGDCPLPPPPPPPPPLPPAPIMPHGGASCGPGKVCGSVIDSETGTVNLVGMVIELRNDKGTYIKTTRTISNGSFEFSGLTGSGYLISPSLNPSWSSDPSFSKTLPADGHVLFKMGGVPANVTITGSSGDFIMISSSATTGPFPLGVYPGGPFSISGVIGRDGKKLMSISKGKWFLTCWRSRTYNKGHAMDLGIIKAQDVLTAECPQ